MLGPHCLLDGVGTYVPNDHLWGDQEAKREDSGVGHDVDSAQEGHTVILLLAREGGVLLLSGERAESPSPAESCGWTYCTWPARRLRQVPSFNVSQWKGGKKQFRGWKRAQVKRQLEKTGWVGEAPSREELGGRLAGGEEAAGCTSHRALQTRGTGKWSRGARWEEMKEAGRREDYRSARNNKEEGRREGKIMQGLEGQKSQLQKDS